MDSHGLQLKLPCKNWQSSSAEPNGHNGNSEQLSTLPDLLCLKEGPKADLHLQAMSASEPLKGSRAKLHAVALCTRVSLNQAPNISITSRMWNAGNFQHDMSGIS